MDKLTNTPNGIGDNANTMMRSEQTAHTSEGFPKHAVKAGIPDQHTSEEIDLPRVLAAQIVADCLKGMDPREAARRACEELERLAREEMAAEEGAAS